MLNIFRILTILILILPHMVISVNVECIFYTNSWGGSLLGNFYYCSVQNIVNITTPEGAIITSYSGTHSSGKTSDDVLGIAFWSRKIHYFPRGLEKIFKNMKVIQVSASNLKEIRKSDFQPFSSVSELFLLDNDIQTLEEGLFENNSELKVIILSGNKIAEVHADVFINLNKLVTLDLTVNVCIDRGVRENATEVQSIIQQVRLQCPSPVTTTTTEAPEDYECPESCSLQIEQLSQDFETFRTSSTENFARIDLAMKNLSVSSANNLEKIINLEQKVVSEIQQLNNTLQIQIKGIEDNLESSISDVQSDLTQKIDDFISKSLPDIVQLKVDESFKEAEARIIENVENAVQNLSDELKTSTNASLVELKDKIENVEDRLDNFICETSIRLHKLETSLGREQTKMMRITDAKISVMKKELKDEINKKFISLEEKLDKLLSIMNIEI